MAKTAVKRKSEGDVPDQSKKQKVLATMTVRNASDDVDSPEHHSSSDELFIEQPVSVYVKKGRPKARRSAPVRRHDDEYDEDEGRMESQQFLALVEMQSRKKKMAAKSAGDFMEKFKSTIQNEEQALRQRVERFGEVTTNEDGDFINTFTKAYNASRPTNPPKSQLAQNKRPITDIYFSTLYKRSRHLITNARSIISQFDSASETTAKLEAGGGLLKNEWEAENESMVQLMAIGHKVGLEKVEAMLHGMDIPQVEEGDGQFVDMLYGVEGNACVSDGLPWGKLAKKQLKAGKRLYKTTVVMEMNS